MRQERLLSVGTDGGGYINLLCTNKDDLSLGPMSSMGTRVPGASRWGMRLGAGRHSLPLSYAVASCAPRPPDLQPAGEGAYGVSRPEGSSASLVRKLRMSVAEAPLSLSRAVTVTLSM